MERAKIGTRTELVAQGFLTGKVGAQPVCVFWSEGRAYAVDDRCPHMGFPLHRGTVEHGLLTCLWHHARFDLVSGGTLDPFADDVHAHSVEIEGDDVLVTVQPTTDPSTHLLARLREGLEQGLSLVIAKAVLGLFELLDPTDAAAAAVKVGIEFGTRNRDAGWGSGLTVLTAMANVADDLASEVRALAIIHGLVFVARDTNGRPPRFALSPLNGAVPIDRLGSWYRRFVDTRNVDAAERVLTTAAAMADKATMSAFMGAAIADHLFIDGGHTIDFTNKAFEALTRIGWEHAPFVLPTVVRSVALASRSEESGQWRHPDDIVGVLAPTQALEGPAEVATTSFGDNEVDALARSILDATPDAITRELDAALRHGATYEQLARAVAFAAALRLVHFHVQNDHGDWDVVHHGFTAAHATHQMVHRSPTKEVARSIYHAAMKIYLDRFLNVPAARLPSAAPIDTKGDLDQLQACWDREGMVDEAGGLVYRWLTHGGERTDVVAALGVALLEEDAQFHWYQVYEAAVRQSAEWPDGSKQAALILTGAARFLAAHTPTRRELSGVVRIATRLRRGEALYEEI